MPRRPFTASFTQQLPIPEAEIAAAVAVMQSGRLHRYDTGPGEAGEVAALEREYAVWQGTRPDAARQIVADLSAVGVEVKWFGASDPVGFSSAHQSWGYVPPKKLLKTAAIRATLFDMRLPLTFTLADCDLIAGHIGDALLALQLEGAA